MLETRRRRFAVGPVVAAVALSATLLAVTPASAQQTRSTEATAVQLSEFTIRDRAAGLEWLRCSAGQTWNGYTCIGVARMLSWSEAEQAAAMASRELGGNWRLPTLKELQGLVCDSCAPPKIDLRLYPNTMATAYWTSSKNRWSFGRYWTVNFYTGYTFGRNTADMARHVRLVRDLPSRTLATPP